MTTPTPYAGESAQRLVNMINSDNNSALKLGVDFNFSNMSPYSDASGRNTKITMVATDSAQGSVTVHYWRLPLTVLNDLPAGYIQPVLIDSLPFSLHGILDRINTALGLNLTTDEVVDQTFTAQQDTYPLQINEATSLAWLNSNYAFPAVFSANLAVPATDLPGFDPVA